jgi:hypothetical protein
LEAAGVLVLTVVSAYLAAQVAAGKKIRQVERLARLGKVIRGVRVVALPHTVEEEVAVLLPQEHLAQRL